MNRSLSLVLLTALLACLPLALGQEGPKQDPPKQQDAPRVDPPPAEPAPDPFRGQRRRSGNATLDALPTLQLRALIQLEGRPALALIGIGDTNQVVRAGEVLNVAPRANGPRIHLEVTAISRDGVTLRHPESGEELSLR